jgi:hypothetical protein
VSLIVKTTFVISQNKRHISIVLFVALLLLIPFVAMQFTNEVNWSLFDFVIMGALLLTTSFMGELVLRKVKKVEYRIFIILVIAIAFFLIWAELAVGILGTPLSGN